MAELFTLPARATNSNGDNLSGAKLYFYATGTTTPQAVYSDSGLTTPHANPVVADSGGKFAGIYLDPVLTYRAVLKTSDGVTTIYDLDPIGSGANAADIRFTAKGTGAVARTVGERLGETISVKDFGAVGDGITNDTAAFSLAFAAAAGKILTIPAGTYRLNSTPTAPTGSITIKGEDGATLLIAHGGTRALYFTPAATTNVVSITGLILQAGYSAGPCPLGIDIEYPSAASFPYEQVHLDVAFRGDLSSTAAPWANTWARGVRLKNVWYPFIKINGSSYPDLGNTGATGALEIVGGSYGCIGGKFLIRWYYGAYGILASAYMEGCTLLDGSELVNVTKGWAVPSSTPLGGAAGTDRSYRLTIDNAHIAAWTAAVDMDTVRGFQSMGADIQRTSSVSATSWTGYLFNQCQRPQIIGGLIAGNEASGGITTVGINATGANSAHGVVTGVNFENLDTQFILAAATTSWTISDNRSTGATSDTYSLAGSKHKIEWLNNDGTVTYASDQLSGPISTGQYTPTLTGVANVAASSAYVSRYTRVGNMVTVFGRLDLDPTSSAVYTQLGISLPVASNFTAAEQCAGAAGSGTQGVGAQIVADTTNDRAELQVLPNTAANHGYSFTFTYQVL